MTGAIEREAPPILELYLTYEQWQEEHDALRERLLELCRLVRWHPGNPDENVDGEAQHRQIATLFVPFMRDWQRHLDRERRTLYPLVGPALCGGRIGPACVLEQDGRIAGVYYEAYREAAADGVPAEEKLSLLQQVLLIVIEHYRIEDETIVPAAEKLMDAIAYSGS